MRDYQRSRVYLAERAAFHEKGMLPEYKTVEQVQAFTDRVTASKLWRTHRPFSQGCWVDVVDGRGSRKARALTPHAIAMPKWSRRRWVILHELAHCLAPWSEQHSWRFCQMYIALVSRFLGRAAAARLRAEFRRHRVRYTQPRAKRLISPEQRSILVARLAAYREAKAATEETHQRTENK